MVKTWDSLIKLLAAGDKRAYEAVFREFYRPLVLYARKFVLDGDVAEDIVQGFFCHLWEDRKHMAEIKSFITYFYSAIRNRALNYIRDKHIVSLEGVEIEKEEDFLKEMMEEEIYRELYAAIRELPDKCRAVFMLKLAGKENTEIAAELKVTEETVRSQLRRGRELLRKNIQSLTCLALLFYWGI